MTCKCKRIKKEFPCEAIRKKIAIIECDETCSAKKEEQRKIREAQEEQKRKDEEVRNQKELEKYQKMFEGKKKTRDRRIYEEEKQENFIKKYWIIILISTVLSISIGLYLSY